MSMKLVGRALLLSALAACGGHSEETKPSPKVATDTLVERKQVVDTMVVKTDTTIANSLLVQMGHRVVKFTGLLPSDCQHAPEYHLNNVQTEHETGMQGVGASPNRA